MPFDRLVEVLNPARSLARHPLFQIMLALQNATDGDLDLPGLKITGEAPGRHSVSKFDMTVAFFEQRAADGTPRGLHGKIEYATDLFDQGTVRRFADRLVLVLDAVVAEPERPIGAMDLLGPDERSRILVEWNDTAGSVPVATVPELFAEQVALGPDRTAVVLDDIALSYVELNRRANQVAHHLIGLGVGPESVVALRLPRSVDMVVAVLGVLKAGGAYLPVDPDYPADRIDFMLGRDAAPQVVP